MRCFAADLHLQHPKLAGLRGFESVPAHDEYVISRLAELTADDELWVLGDICSGGVASMESALTQLSELAVPMHLVTGNHDPVHPMSRGAQRHFAAYASVFSSVQQYARVKIGGEGAVLSHFPYAGRRTDSSATSSRSTSFRTSACGCCTVTRTRRNDDPAPARSVCRSKPGTSGRPPRTRSPK